MNLSSTQTKNVKNTRKGYWLGKKRSKETNEKISKAMKGRRCSPGTEFKKGSPGPWLGKKRDRETVEKQRRAITGRPNPKASAGLKLAYKNGLRTWNKGLKKSDHPSIERTAIAVSAKKKGVRPSEETIAKQVASATGRVFSDETKSKIKESLRKHYDAKGRNKDIRQRIKRLSLYVAWRNSVFTRDDWTCQICGERGGKIEADHIRPFSAFIRAAKAKYGDNESAFLAIERDVEFWDIRNGRTLCKPCHKATPTYSRGAKNFS